VWNQDLLSLLTGKLTRNKRQIRQLTIKYQFVTFKKLWLNGIKFAFYSWSYMYMDLISVWGLNFVLCLHVFLSLVSSSLQSATCTVVSLQPLHLPQPLTLRTKLPFANTIHTSCSCGSHSKECFLPLQSAMLYGFFILSQDADFYTRKIL